MLWLLAACHLPEEPSEDHSLEAFSISNADGLREAEGIAAVSADVSEGDWLLDVQGDSFRLHSASRADLSVLDGRELRVEIDDIFSSMDSARLLEGEIPVFVESIQGDGIEVFGRPVWGPGEEIGRGTIGGDLAVIFREVVLDADDGEVILMPGEPTAVTIDGTLYRATVIASYAIDTSGGGSLPECGPSDLLAIELFRVDEAVRETPLVRPSEFGVASNSCG